MTVPWKLAEGLNATFYSLSYSNTNTDCFNDTGHLITTGNVFVLHNLQDGAEYSLTVTASLSNGRVEENSTIITTPPSG